MENNKKNIETVENQILDMEKTIYSELDKISFYIEKQATENNDNIESAFLDIQELLNKNVDIFEEIKSNTTYIKDFIKSINDDDKKENIVNHLSSIDLHIQDILNNVHNIFTGAVYGFIIIIVTIIVVIFH